MKRIINLIVLLSLYCQIACTTIYIDEADGQSRIERSFGKLVVNIEPENQMQRVQVKNFGILRINNEFTAGYNSTDVTYIPESCHLVIWTENKEQIETILQLLDDNENICISQNR